MNDSKLTDRQKKHTEKMNGSMTNNSLLLRREEVNLSLRKNKVFETIMQRRLKNFNAAKNFQTELEINVEKLNIPTIIQTNLESCSNKLMTIERLLLQSTKKPKIIEDESQNNDESKNITRFAIHKLRKISQVLYKLKDQEEVNLIVNGIFPILQEIFMKPLDLESKEDLIDSLRLKYEISWIYINFSSDSQEFTDKLLEISNLKHLETMINECLGLLSHNEINTRPLIKHFLTLIGNTLGQDSQSNTIVKNSIDIVPKLIHFLSEDDKEDWKLNSQSFVSICLWASQNFMRYTCTNIKYKYFSLLKTVLDLMSKLSIMEPVNLELFSEGLQTLAYFSDNSDLVKIFLENKGMPILSCAFSIVSVENNKDSLNDISNIIKILSELMSGNNEETTFILSYKIFERYQEIATIINERTSNMTVEGNELIEKDSIIIRNICMGYANLASSTDQIIEKMIFNAKFIELIFSIYYKFDYHVKYEILHLFNNAFVTGSNHIKSEIIRLNVHKIHIELINQISNSSNPNLKMLKLSLHTLTNFLEFCESVSKINVVKVDIENEAIQTLLEKLQFNENYEICDMANYLVHTYWGDTDNFYNEFSDIIKR